MANKLVAHILLKKTTTGCCPTWQQMTQTFATKKSLSYTRTRKCHRRRRATSQNVHRLGRATNNVGIGIVGLPNVGKSTFQYSIQVARTCRKLPVLHEEPNLQKSLYQSAILQLCKAFKPKSEVASIDNDRYCWACQGSF